MPFAPADRARIYYELYGPKPGDAPAIVFAHGNGGNHLSWWQQVPHFRDRFTCLVFDHRGWGRSDEEPGGPGGAAFAADLGAVMDHAGIARATLVAQSMGGWTCLGFALAHPERVERLVMCDTHGGLTSAEIAPLVDAAFRSPPPLPPGVHPAAGVRMHRDQPALHFLYEEIAALNPEMAPRERFAFLRAIPSPTAEQVRRLPMPVHFIAGEEDIVIPPPILDAAAACFAGASVRRVPEAGHSVYFERPDAFNRLLDEFLAAKA